MTKEIGMQVSTFENELLLHLTRKPSAFHRGRRTETVILTKAEAEALALELTTFSRRLHD